MVVHRRAVAAVAALLVALSLAGTAGAAVAVDRTPRAEPVDRRAACERLENAAQALRARIGQIQATQERIRAKLASGELRPPQEARAKHALRKLEALQDELEKKLARVLAVYEEHCTG